ncbi:hypothetical protein GGR50DRAFT_696624 [Xylaria sp. CBS 124048]|nr:hypothetical protein GGR50DRAFT_696624 [Xylaria sp. CBS 124048]
MPIEETLRFEKDEYRKVVATASTTWLREQEIQATRKQVLSGVSVGLGATSALHTGGVSLLLAGYKSRSLYVAHAKLHLIQDELRRRGVELHHFSKSKDFLGPAAVGVTAAVIGNGVTDFIDMSTNIESLGAGLPDGANASTGLLDDPGLAAHGAVDVVEQLVSGTAGDAGAAATMTATDAIATHAGMIQAQAILQEMGQTAGEKVLFSPGKPTPEQKSHSA